MERLSAIEITPYQMCIRNVANYMRTQNVESADAITAFQASEILAISFCKSKEEVMDDLVSEVRR